jgi:hypothetical protein
MRWLKLGFDGLQSASDFQTLLVSSILITLSGLRDVRPPPPIRVAVYFHPKAGCFGSIAYESDDVA